ncbi:hypothetical protein F511_34950 [Dorcoceras hygrometricum]|uniref:Uncharacterized protein n=1 Tax=Dorcoceras hygrometricum TaxID=472368 RepID=A0A2Z7CB45_9LAMI|nr:hypothetical protein F511_34950 [Dorcoceras hygrometricum]
MGLNPSTESKHKTASNNKNKMQMLCTRWWTTTKSSNRKGSQSTAQLNLQQMVATGCVPSVVANHSPEDNTRIPDASTTRPAVAQPMNCDWQPQQATKHITSKAISQFTQAVTLLKLQAQPEAHNKARNKIQTKNRKATCNDENRMQEQQLRAFDRASYSFQKRYRMKELFERSPTLPRMGKTVAGINGKRPEKVTVNSTKGLKKTENEVERNISKGHGLVRWDRLDLGVVQPAGAPTMVDGAGSPRGVKKRGRKVGGVMREFGLQCPTSPLLPPRKVPLEDLIYTSCTEPIPQPASARNPRLHQSSAVTHLFYAYVRKATNTEFNVVVLGRDLILHFGFEIHSLYNIAQLSRM